MIHAFGKKMNKLHSLGSVDDEESLKEEDKATV